MSYSTKNRRKVERIPGICARDAEIFIRSTRETTRRRENRKRMGVAGTEYDRCCSRRIVDQ